MTRPDWRSWGREALERGPDCPDDETLRTWAERGDQASGAPGDLGAHVASCARCRLEADEMRHFFAAPDDSDSAAREIEQGLRASLSSGRATGTGHVLPAPRAHRGGLLVWAGLAAAGVAAALLIALWPDAPPSLPALPEGGGSVRGAAAPVLLHPTGDIAEVPGRLAWRPAEGDAGPWAVRLETVDGVVIWSATATAQEVTLPEGTRTALRPGSSYIWRVSGPGEGAPAAAGSFRIAPASSIP